MGDVTLAQATDWLARFKQAVVTGRGYLTELDSAIGDADHGTNLARGMTAVVDKLAASPAETIGGLLSVSGMTLVSTVGGASGPLYGTYFLRIGKSLGEAPDVDAVALGTALRAGLDGLIARGKAELGDKTMVDALTPATRAYESTVGAGGSAADAARVGAAAAAEGRDATEPLVARKGRASYLGERSAGHIDPGAASATMLMESLAEALAVS
ncbi:MAG: dihydroxyacetone kinase subunit DhaL [Nocardioidaceae bacterium]